MDFTVSEQARGMIQLMQRFMEREVFPLERAFLNQGFPAIESEAEGLRRKVGQMGPWAPAQPEECGGIGLPLKDGDDYVINGQKA